MTEHEILESFSRILRDLIGDESIVLTMETKREDVAGWDSFSYVNFIATVEMEVGIKFMVADIESFENVGAIVVQTRKLLLNATPS